MKKFTLLSIAAFFAATFGIFLVACQKDEVKNPTVENPVLFKGVSFNDDVLVFENEAAIQMLTEIMLSDRTNTTKMLKSQFPTFKSNNDAYEDFKAKTDLEIMDMQTLKENNHLLSLFDENGEKIVDKTIDSYFLSSIANEKGFFQVSNILYKVDRDFVYQYDAQSKKEIKKDKIIRNATYGESRDEFGECLEFNDCTSKLKRVCGKIFTTSYIAYSEAGINTKCRKKGLLGWVDHDGASININGTYTIVRLPITNPSPNAPPCSTTTFTDNVTRFNTDVAESIGTSCWTCCNRLFFTTVSCSGNVVTCGSAKSISFQQ